MHREGYRSFVLSQLKCCRPFTCLSQNALKHEQHTFLYRVMGELVSSGQLRARAALRQLGSYKVQ